MDVKDSLKYSMLKIWYANVVRNRVAPNIYLEIQKLFPLNETYFDTCVGHKTEPFHYINGNLTRMS